MEVVGKAQPDSDLAVFLFCEQNELQGEMNLTRFSATREIKEIHVL